MAAKIGTWRHRPTRYLSGIVIVGLFALLALGFGAVLRLVALQNCHRMEIARSNAAIGTLTRTGMILARPENRASLLERNTAISLALSEVDTLEALLADDPAQTKSLASLRQMIAGLDRPIGTAGTAVAPGSLADTVRAAERLRTQWTEQVRARTAEADLINHLAGAVMIFIGVLSILLTVLGMRLSVAQSRAHERVERSLRDSEARYRLIAEYASDVIFQLDLDLTREYMSPACLSVLGYPPEELIGKRATSQFHPDDRPQVARAHQALLDGSDLEIVTARNKRGDGQWVWLEARVRLVRDCGGKPSKIIGLMTDITARREAEIALRQNEEKYRSLYNCTPAMMYSLDPDNRVLTVSDRMLETFGYTREEVIGRRSTEFMTESARQKMALLTRPEFLASGIVIDAPTQFVTKAGEVRDVLLSGISDRDENGRLARALVVVVDVTERIRMEQALRESEEQYRLVADNASDLIVRIDRDGKRKYASPSFQRIMGYDHDEILSQKVASYIIPEDQAEAIAAYQTMFATGEGMTMRARARRKDGQIIWLEATNTVIFDPATGEAAEIVSFVRDVTERQIANEQAEQARREAELANRAKSDFLATMSHEIRTPMNGVLGFATLLLDTGLSDEQRVLVSRLKGAGESLLAIISDVLDLSKIENGSLELETIPLSLRDVVAAAADMVDAAACAKGLSLTVAIADDVHDRVIGDPTRLRQVLLNLLSNAVKFTETGGVTLRIGYEPAARDRLQFQVVDTGIGIPADRQHLLFQSFSQVDTSTTRRFGGTGLGLAISRRLVAAMPGGRIGVDSIPGKGSCFWFSVCLPTADEDNAETVRETLAKLSRPARILVAEDMVINQLVVEGILSHAGHHVDLVTDGVAAVSAVTDGAYDLVLMDMQMPVMDGLDATRAIRALAGPKCDIPIIALSANAMRGEIDLCLDAGMNGHLAKPIEKEALLSTVETWCGLAA